VPGGGATGSLVQTQFLTTLPNIIPRNMSEHDHGIPPDMPGCDADSVFWQH
jgi:hypothetical protein